MIILGNANQFFSYVFKNLFHKKFGKITEDSLNNNDQKISFDS